MLENPYTFNVTVSFALMFNLYLLLFELHNAFND